MMIQLTADQTGDGILDFEYKDKKIGIYAYDEFYENCYGGVISIDDWKRLIKIINELIADEVDKGLE